MVPVLKKILDMEFQSKTWPKAAVSKPENGFGSESEFRLSNDANRQELQKQPDGIGEPLFRGTCRDRCANNSETPTAV
jgi:hypothetical protein